jgi:hypothetical protein
LFIRVQQASHSGFVISLSLNITPTDFGENCGVTPVKRASSTGRCNTIQCIDSAMLLRENHLFGCTRPKLSQGNVPVGRTPASDFGFCFQCKVGSSFVLRPPIETAERIRYLEAEFVRGE